MYLLMFFRNLYKKRFIKQKKVFSFKKKSINLIFTYFKCNKSISKNKYEKLIYYILNKKNQGLSCI